MLNYVWKCSDMYTDNGVGRLGPVRSSKSPNPDYLDVWWGVPLVPTSHTHRAFYGPAAQKRVAWRLFIGD